MTKRPSARASAPGLSKALANGEQIRVDSWANLLSGLGTSRDKSRSYKHFAGDILSVRQLENLFTFDDLAKLICSAIVEDGMRPGFCITTDAGDHDPKHVAALEGALKTLGVAQGIKAAAIWGRTYGRGALLLGAKGSTRPEEPMPEGGADLAFVTPLVREDLSIAKVYQDPLMPKFGQPELFRLQRQGAAGTTGTVIVVHESRLIQFGGVLTPPLFKAANDSCDLSVLQAVYDALRGANGNWDSVCALLADLSQSIIKMRGLIQAIAAGNEAAIHKRIAIMDASRSSVRSVLLDAEGEDFGYAERGAVTGVGDLLDKTWLRLAAAARMPVSRLLGQAPAGLNATGEGDRIWWYDGVRECERDILAPGILTVVKTISPTVAPGVDPEDWRIKFNPLEEPMPGQQADLRNKVAQTDKLYVDMGVVLPEELAISRFGGGEWSPEYVIDTEARETALEAEIAAMIDPPEPDPNAPPDPADPNTPPPEGGPSEQATNGRAPAGGDQAPGRPGPNDQAPRQAAQRRGRRSPPAP